MVVIIFVITDAATLTADFTYVILRLCIETFSVGFAAYVTLMISGRIVAFANHTVTVIALVISVFILAITHRQTAPIAHVALVIIIAFSVLNTANVAYVVLFFVHGTLT